MCCFCHLIEISHLQQNLHSKLLLLQVKFQDDFVHNVFVCHCCKELHYKVFYVLSVCGSKTMSLPLERHFNYSLLSFYMVSQERVVSNNFLSDF